MSFPKAAFTLILLFIGLNFLSCDNEPVDPALTALINAPVTEDCETPQSFTAGPLGSSHAVVLNWVAPEGTGAWQIQYGPSGFIPGSGTSVSATAPRATITGLTASTTYQFYIRTVCSSTNFSSWFGPVSPGNTIGSCSGPTGFSVVRALDNTSAAVSWNALAGVFSYQIQYGATGFTLGTGTLVSATVSPKNITALTASQGYDFYIRTNCTSAQSSEWTGPFHVDGGAIGP